MTHSISDVNNNYYQWCVIAQSSKSGPVVSISFLELNGMWCVAHKNGALNVWKGMRRHPNSDDPLQQIRSTAIFFLRIYSG